MLAISVLFFGLAWWFGLYLPARDPRNPLLQRVGAGLLLYAVALAGLDAFGDSATSTTPATLVALLPALAWSGALPLFLPAEQPLRGRLDRLWRRSTPLLLIVLSALLLQSAAQGLLIAAFVTLLPLLIGFATMIYRRHDLPSPQVRMLAFSATIFFIVGVLLLPAPPFGLSRQWVVLGLGADLALLGLAAALWDAFEAGERLRRDLLRSLLSAAIAATIFGGQVAAALAFGGALSGPATLLLYSSVALAVTLVVLGNPLNALLDRLSFPGALQLQQDRAALRAIEDALPRRNNDTALWEMDEATFAKLTRRALSSYGDLPRLAASPLIELPIIDQRLQERQIGDRPLERAAELKTLLAECIVRLKPRGDDTFGASAEWRHYNVLYFPYVVGLKPFSRRGVPSDLPANEQAALEWLAQLPERTLYNWQNAAARLVADDLRRED